MANRQWCNRYCEEDGSWIRDILTLVEGKSPEKWALLEHFAYGMCEFLDHIDGLKESCESPIEIKFLDALIREAPMHGLPIAYVPNELADFHFDREITYGLYINPQYKMTLAADYRADFFLTTKDRNKAGNRKLIVECDGHDFHERTKEQAKRDRSRDRDMTSNGYTVMRFTGSEIHKDARACAEQVCAYLSRFRS